MNRPTTRSTLARAAALALAATLAAGTFAGADDAKPAAPAEVKPSVNPVGAPTAAASDPNTLTDQEKADGWRLLFDGKSADQFRAYNKPADGGIGPKWEVKDGVLSQPGKGGDTITKEQFENFDLSLEYRIGKGGNSGLMFHVIEVKGKPPYDSGPEIQIQDNVDGHDPQKAGWLYQFYQAPIDAKTGKPIDATKPAGEWNQLRLKLDHGKGEIFMNGVKYSSFEIGSDEWNQKLAKSKFAKWENFAKAKTGYICLQDHGDAVAFRSIKIKPLGGK
ncbi:MAG: yliI [Phycisphaerales bacterium]|nr:yliI [Phycisphaerales bacterium]